MSSLKLQKRLAASVMKCGKNKVRLAFPVTFRAEFISLVAFVTARNVL
jgi:ribosomal protein L19E